MPTANAYSDVPNNHNFKKEIDHLVQLGAISGYPDGTYKPNHHVTRGQAAKIITVALNMPLVNPTTPTFKDVPKTHGSYQYIETLVAKGIISGYADGTFKPNNPVKRAHMAKILSTSLNLTEQRDFIFKDVPKSSEYYPYVSRLATSAITYGRGDGTFGLHENVSRGHMAAFVSRGINMLISDNNSLLHEELRLGRTQAEVIALEGTPDAGSPYDIIYHNKPFSEYLATVHYAFGDDSKLYGIYYEVNLSAALFDQAKAEKVHQSFVEDMYLLGFEKPDKLTNNHAEWVIDGNNYVDLFLEFNEEEDIYVIHLNVITY